LNIKEIGWEIETENKNFCTCISFIKDIWQMDEVCCLLIIHMIASALRTYVGFLHKLRTGLARLMN